MKGFVRILESIIASVIILSSITFFFSPSIRKFGWDDSNLHTEIYDSIESLYKSGNLNKYVMNNDADGINKELSSIIKKNIDFSVSVKGIPNREILVSCLCTDEEEDLLNNILTPKEFKYHNRIIRIGVEKADISQNAIIMRQGTQILFLFEYRDLSPYRNQLGIFLSSGGSIFILSDLTENQVNDGYINETFGLKWKSSGMPSGTGTFYDESSPENISFKISKYYSNFTGVVKTFDKFSSASRIAPDDNTIIIDNEFSLVKANKISAKGRSVWFADYTDKSEGNTSLLVKAAVMWSSGEMYSLDPIKKNIPQTSSVSSLIVFGEDPYELSVNYWKIF